MPDRQDADRYFTYKVYETGKTSYEAVQGSTIEFNGGAVIIRRDGDLMVAYSPGAWRKVD